jgi:hypothetical protein
MKLARVEEVIVTMTDDIDGGRATETITFALEGASYQIDLSKRNADGLRRSLKPYIEAGRRIRRASKSRGAENTRRSASAVSEGYDRAEVRAWAKSHRIKVAPRGRIANNVVERWLRSNGT